MKTVFQNTHYHFTKLSFAVIISAIFFIHLFSCEEVGPDINLNETAIDTTLIDTTYLIASLPAPQQKIVALEEFTGVRCINCPDGHEQIYNILNTYPGRVAVISLHSNFLGAAYDGQPELRIGEAQDLEELLGPAAAKPMASIDRVLFSGETSVLQFLQQWSGRVSQQINAPVPVNIEIENRLQENDLITKITLTYLQSVGVENRITVLLTEDSITAAQLTDAGIDYTYQHQHVARAFITRYNGNVLNYALEKGRVIVKEFRYNNMPSSWKRNHLKVVCLVHEYGASMKVLQAAQKKVLP